MPSIKSINEKENVLGFEVLKIRNRDKVTVTVFDNDGKFFSIEEAIKMQKDKTKKQNSKNSFGKKTKKSTYYFKIKTVYQDSVDENYKERDKKLWESGHYRKTPFHDDPILKPFVEEYVIRLSRKTSHYIEFFRNESRAKRNLPTHSSIGKFINNRTDLICERSKVDSEKVYRLRSLYSSIMKLKYSTDYSYELKIAETSEDAAYVYENGPRSCMSNPRNDYNSSPHHPAETYGENSDLKVAYVEKTCLVDKNKDKKGEVSIVARVLCCPSKKIYAKSGYGDSGLVYHMLQDEGYRESKKCSNFYGIKLKKIEINFKGKPAIVCPFLDSPLVDRGGGVRINANSLELTGSAKSTYHYGDSQNGILQSKENMNFCADCDEGIYEDDFAINVGDYLICENCSSSYVQCPNCEDYSYKKDIRAITDLDFKDMPDYRCKDCFEELCESGHVGICQKCDDSFYDSDMIDGLEFCKKCCQKSSNKKTANG